MSRRAKFLLSLFIVATIVWLAVMSVSIVAMALIPALANSALVILPLLVGPFTLVGVGFLGALTYDEL